MKKDMVNVKVIVSETLGIAIERATRERNISKSQFVKEALEVYLLRSSVTTQ